MSRPERRWLLFFVVALMVMGFATAALGQTEGGDSGGDTGATTTTVSSGLSPAVEVSTEQTPPAPADWTYRYLIPTGLAIAVIIVLITAVKYFTDVVRKRYRIVE
jgi:hypothetical protein